MLNPLSFLQDFTILSFVFHLVYFVTKKPKFLYLNSIIIGLAIIFRPQGVYLILPFILLNLNLFKINYRQFIKTLIPLALILTSQITYNKVTFNKWSLSQISELTKIGTAINFLEPNPQYPTEVNNNIQLVQSELSKSKNALNPQNFNYTEYKQIFSARNYDLCWVFTKEIYRNNQAINQMIANVYSNSRLSILRYQFFNFIYCFEFNFRPYYFYYNELENRNFYISKSNEFHPNLSSPFFNQLIFKNFHKSIVTKRVVFKRKEDESIVTKAHHRYEILYNYLFRNHVILMLSVLFFGVFAFNKKLPKKGFVFHKIALTTLSFIFANFCIIAYSIFPQPTYVEITFPIILILFFIQVQQIKLLYNGINYNNAMP
ncbi:MAG: hypothetical protein KKH44_04645 [Bacteroidetes bacterium]|nr:hypothetical protein [Bacteroidota bacterium]